jgi:hypothetical protein
MRIELQNIIPFKFEKLDFKDELPQKVQLQDKNQKKQ